jgi:hypothetical protein
MVKRKKEGTNTAAEEGECGGVSDLVSIEREIFTRRHAKEPFDARSGRVSRPPPPMR